MAQQSNAYWRRVYRITFPDIGLEYNNTDDPNNEAINISFDIDRDLTQETNKAKIKLWNLVGADRSKIEKEDQKLELYAGYRDNGGAQRIFTGTIIQAYSEDKGTDIITEITGSDGQIPVRDTAVSLSYAPGTDGGTIVKAVAGQMGIPLVEGEGVSYEAYPHGYSFVGRAAEALNEVCNGQGLNWSIQNGELQVILGFGVAAQTGVVFSSSTGLVGFPPTRIVQSRPKEDKLPGKRQGRQSAKKEEPEKKAGWKIETLLCPTVNPGDAVKVESRVVTGWFRIETLKHTGELYGNDYRTQMELIEGLGAS